MKRTIVTLGVALLIAGMYVSVAEAHLVQPFKGSSAQKLKAAKTNLAHAKYVCRRGSPFNKKAHCPAVPWLEKVVARHYAASDAAWAWYRRSDTQCVVRHEGGWTSINPAGYYGRFQMDVSFQNETAYGRAAYRRWGTAEKWPPAVQVQHAYSIWLYAGWSRWPTYYRYCR